ncbi:hypothetical protein A3A38_01785 [Candidatus Kaiserbacteria bacterium RIFCSPLOWO2_01_FULL_53_17]|uniref:Type II toxin-antitoxin system PemK/MazF family toxin n=1 Tax=Candidatus Kaiserbacteria bacterium RIFCSPLOWO2_01_FULL_53_17 TaxID=1798511 RepID=A0A1F6EHT1_9BACT|nr:MAG: hypothetical protein A3A38_01785 [Candidatus Kaiserbacteria bacterium RIFCSPLOWO2_01_FULL_53_17]
MRSYTKASGLCTVCPITSQVKGYANEISLTGDVERARYESAAFVSSSRGARNRSRFTTGGIVGAILSDQHKTIDIDARALRRVGKVPPAVLADIRTHIGLILGIIPA